MALVWEAPSEGATVYSECPTYQGCEYWILRATPPAGQGIAEGRVQSYDLATGDLITDWPLLGCWPDEPPGTSEWNCDGSCVCNRAYWHFGGRDTRLAAQVTYTGGGGDGTVVELVRIRSVIVTNCQPGYLIWLPSGQPRTIDYTVANTKHSSLKVSVTIYGGSGSPVRHLLSDYYDQDRDMYYSLRAPGAHQEAWDGGTDPGIYYPGNVVPPGVYPYEIHVEAVQDVCHGPDFDNKNSVYLTIT